MLSELSVCAACLIGKHDALEETLVEYGFM